MSSRRSYFGAVHRRRRRAASVGGSSGCAARTTPASSATGTISPRNAASLCQNSSLETRTGRRRAAPGGSACSRPDRRAGGRPDRSGWRRSRRTAACRARRGHAASPRRPRSRSCSQSRGRRPGRRRGEPLHALDLRRALGAVEEDVGPEPRREVLDRGELQPRGLDRRHQARQILVVQSASPEQSAQPSASSPREIAGSLPRK